MSVRSVLLGCGFIVLLCDVRASSCDTNCTIKPVFKPSRLVVKYGDPTSATCLVCPSDCPQNLFGLEKSVGVHSTKGPEISWKVDKMTEWDPSPKCYYNVDAKQCCSTLPVTVYKPPDRVSIKGSGPMIEGQRYTLSCTVQNVAPANSVKVTFYKGTTPLGPPLSNKNQQKTPADEVYTVNIIPTKGDNSIDFRCEAVQDLGADGPQPPLVVKSTQLVAHVDSGAVTPIPGLTLGFVISVFSQL